MNLTEKPTIVLWPEIHFVYVEKVGPFQETAAKAWEALHAAVPALLEHKHKITGYLSLYKVEEQIYRAGVSLAEAPNELPKGLKSVQFKGGKYSRFVLKGSYADLPEACGRVFGIVEKIGVKTRKDFYIENYVTDPRSTPMDQAVTEILIPTA